MVYIPNTTYIVSTSYDGTLKIWDYKKQQLIKTPEGHKYSVTSVTVIPDLNYIVSGSEDETIKIWNY